MHDNTHTVRLNSAARVPYRKNKERVTHQLKEYCSVNISVETKVKRVINQSRGGKKTKRCTVCLRYTVLYTYRFLRVMVKDVFAKDLYHITCFVFFYLWYCFCIAPENVYGVLYVWKKDDDNVFVMWPINGLHIWQPPWWCHQGRQQNKETLNICGDYFVYFLTET